MSRITSVELNFKMKKQMMLDVATGMQYLHSLNPVIIHRDLKSLNVLIDENWVTKVRYTSIISLVHLAEQLRVDNVRLCW